MHDDADDGSINGNRYIPFTGLIRLEKQPQQRRAADDGSPATFRSLAKAFAPGGGTSAYGGHVFAQAVWAAAHTVKDGFVNVTGFFTLPGNTAFPFIYTVRTVDLRELYKVALGDKRPDEWPEAPGVDSPWYWEASAKNDNYTDPFPGLSLRKVDMSAYNAPRKPLDRRQLQFYTTIGSMPPVSQNANLHACAHLYASDRNGLFVITNHLGAGDDYSAMATLSHSVVFHVGAKELEMAEQDDRGARKWYCQESRVSRASGGRGMLESRIWSEGGVHIATTWQDGLVKMEKTGQLAEKLQERFGPSVAREKL
ncbi:hypothetical protein SLS56_007162 [Neofusicoccum ribis]|uniref:Thioesterase/thiol ester dehydrase-isomerase n=1 Tax=Neofusicoccum ribis TaxID=45134 RepID=A0ABR3SNV7_9PEZI